MITDKEEQRIREIVREEIEKARADVTFNLVLDDLHDNEAIKAMAERVAAHITEQGRRL